MGQKKNVDFCKGCPDNGDPEGSTARVTCVCSSSVVNRFFMTIERGDKNRDKHCPQRRKVVRATASKKVA